MGDIIRLFSDRHPSCCDPTDNTMALPTIRKDYSPLDTINKHDLYEHWLKNAEKVMFGEHQLSIEVDDVTEFFVQKAKEELRETPEVVAQSFEELRKLLAGNDSLVAQKSSYRVTSAKSCCP